MSGKFREVIHDFLGVNLVEGTRGKGQDISVVPECMFEIFRITVQREPLSQRTSQFVEHPNGGEENGAAAELRGKRRASARRGMRASKTCSWRECKKR
jgi:hypothetical protein